MIIFYFHYSIYIYICRYKSINRIMSIYNNGLYSIWQDNNRSTCKWRASSKAYPCPITTSLIKLLHDFTVFWWMVITYHIIIFFPISTRFPCPYCGIHEMQAKWNPNTNEIKVGPHPLCSNKRYIYIHSSVCVHGHYIETYVNTHLQSHHYIFFFPFFGSAGK